MTVNDTTSFVSQNGNGSTTIVPYSHPFIAAADLVVNLVVIATGVATLQTLGTNYTISGTAPYPSGANVTMTVAPATGTRVTVDRVRPFTQTLDLVENDPLPADPLELDLDHLVMLAQQLYSRTRRALLLASTSLQSDLTLDDLIANAILVVNAAGTGVTNGPSIATFNASITTATTAAATATTQAGIATTQAGISTTQAGISTTQAGIATTGGTTATTQAGIATTQAGLATAAASGLSAVANAYNYSSTVTMADPSTGNFRLNNATIASATAIAISVLSGDSGNPSLRAYINTWDDSTTLTVLGYLKMRKSGAPGTYAIFAITSAVTDNTTWQQMTLSFIGSSGTFANGDTFYLEFSRTGDKGAAGAGSGDTSTNTATSVVGEMPLFADTTGKLLKRSTLTGGMLKSTSGIPAIAVAGTDYAAPTSGSSFLKGNAAGGFTNQASINLTDLAATTALSTVANATSSSAVPTAVAIGASQLFGGNSGGTALGPISMGTNISISGTTLNVAGGLPSGAVTTVSGTSTQITVDFTTYSAYLITGTGMAGGGGVPVNLDVSSNGGTSYAGGNVSGKSGTTTQVGVDNGGGTFGIILTQASTGIMTAFGSNADNGGASLWGTWSLAAACNKIKFNCANAMSGTVRVQPLTAR